MNEMEFVTMQVDHILLCRVHFIINTKMYFMHDIPEL